MLDPECQHLDSGKCPINAEEFKERVLGSLKELGLQMRFLVGENMTNGEIGKIKDRVTDLERFRDLHDGKDAGGGDVMERIWPLVYVFAGGFVTWLLSSVMNAKGH